MRPNGPNHLWAVDFVHDKLSNNCPYKMLIVLDEYTCYALTVNVVHKMNAGDVLEALYPLHITHGTRAIYVLTTGLSSQLKCLKSGLPIKK